MRHPHASYYKPFIKFIPPDNDGLTGLGCAQKGHEFSLLDMTYNL